MIRLKIGEYSDIKRNSRASFHHESLRGHLHDNTLAAVIDHLPEVSLDIVGFRRGIGGFNMSCSRYYLNCSYKSGLIPTAFEYLANHECRGSLSLSACNSYSKKLLCRVAEICRRHQRKCISAILCCDKGSILPVFGNLHLFLSYNRSRSLPDCLIYEGMTIKYRSPHTYKKAPLYNLS